MFFLQKNSKIKKMTHFGRRLEKLAKVTHNHPNGPKYPKMTQKVGHFGGPTGDGTARGGELPPQPRENYDSGMVAKLMQ